MKDPGSGPFLFDSGAERWLARQHDPEAAKWFHDYLSRHAVNISAVTVMERIRGYALLWHETQPDLRMGVEVARIEYLTLLGTVWPIDTRIAVVAAEIMALIPYPPPITTPTPRLASESPHERMARWRVNIIIAATALVAGLTLIHNNADDFETIRSAIERSPQRFPKLGPLDLIRCVSLV